MLPSCTTASQCVYLEHKMLDGSSVAGRGACARSMQELVPSVGFHTHSPTSSAAGSNPPCREREYLPSSLRSHSLILPFAMCSPTVATVLPGHLLSSSSFSPTFLRALNPSSFTLKVSLPKGSACVLVFVCISRREGSEMERQRSFSVKSSSLLALSVAISSSLVFLTVFSLWALRSAPLIPQEPQLPFDITPTAALSLNASVDAIDFQSPTGHQPGGNFSKASILVGTYIRKPKNTSGSWGSSTTDGIVQKVQSFGSKLLDNDSHIAMSSDAMEALDEHKGEEKASMGVLQRDQVIGTMLLDTAPDTEKSSAGIEALNGKNGGENQVIKLRDCDLGKGRWVYDESYPLYTNWSCPFIDEGFNCGGNGRPDNRYMKWRWQPQDCQIPRLNDLFFATSQMVSPLFLVLLVG